MILFAAGRGEALERFLVEERIGKEVRFWKLAQSLSALYPPGIDESAGLLVCWPGRNTWGYNQEEEVRPMKTITIEVPDDATLPFAASDEQFARELRLAAAIFWYDRGLISQGKEAEIAGLTRADFIDALGQAKVDALQTTAEELKAELERSERERTVDARR